MDIGYPGVSVKFMVVEFQRYGNKSSPRKCEFSKETMTLPKGTANGIGKLDATIPRKYRETTSEIQLK